VIDLDRYVLRPCMTAWGRPVTYYNSTDPPLELLAAFDDKYREETPQGMAGLAVGARPMLGLRAASLPGGQLPAQGELFLVDGRLYAVSNPAEPDGHGHVKVPLRFASDEEARRVA
jgi:hypothetical protein